MTKGCFLVILLSMVNKYSPLSSSVQNSIEEKRAKSFQEAPGTINDKLRFISRFLSRSELGKILAYQHLIEQTKGVVGSIADCGVFEGQGLMTYALLLDLLEPYNYQCKIYGFDTFEGDSKLTDEDFKGTVVDREKYRYVTQSIDAIKESVRIFEESKTLNHIDKISLIKGDLVETAPKFHLENTFVSWRIIHLSVNLYQPTLAVLRHFQPHLSPGGVIAIHGINFTTGASVALKDFVRDSKNALSEMRVIEFYPNLVYVKFE